MGRDLNWKVEKMIKKKTETKEVTVSKILCDFCSVVIEQNRELDGTTCRMCERDMCPEHRVESRDPRNDADDYSVYICIECGEIVNPYFDKIREVKNNCYSSIKSIDKRIKEALANKGVKFVGNIREYK